MLKLACNIMSLTDGVYDLLFPDKSVSLDADFKVKFKAWDCNNAPVFFGITVLLYMSIKYSICLINGRFLAF